MLLKVLVNHQSFEVVQGFLLSAVTGCWLSCYQIESTGQNWMLWACSAWPNYMHINAFEGMFCLQSIWQNQFDSLSGPLDIQGPPLWTSAIEIIIVGK